MAHRMRYFCNQTAQLVVNSNPLRLKYVQEPSQLSDEAENQHRRFKKHMMVLDHS